MTAIDKIKKAASHQPTPMILVALRSIGGSRLSQGYIRTVRAGLIELIAERHGSDAADEIMDEIGM